VFALTRRALSCAQLPATRRHFDVVVACEDEADEDVDCPLVSIRFR
jgi:ubiquitin-activating enzyme E1